MREQTNPSIKELVEEQGLTVRQLRTTLQRLENQGYGNLPIVLATDDEANELRVSASGTSIARFGIAVNDRIKNQQTGEWEDRPNFVDCVAFNGLADTVVKYLAKGAKVALEGKLRYSQWQAQDGSNRSKLEVIVDQVEFMSTGNGQQAQAKEPQQAPYQAAPMVNASVYDDDIPF